MRYTRQSTGGHYLKGEPAPTWITKGISLPKQKQEVRRVARQNGKG